MYKFINPYNFVPFGDEAPEVKDKQEIFRGESQTQLLTGWLDVSMIIKTPLIIPDAAHPKYYDLKKKTYVKKKEDVTKGENENGNKNLHLEYDFLKMYNPETGEKEYTVPGSELRGLIRSIYEAVTNSCVPFLMDDKPISQRVPLYGALHRRGLLGYDGEKWVLYAAEKTLEEVIVIPVYKANGSYYVESIRKIRENPDNNKTDRDGNPKYGIMKHLDEIEDKIPSLEWKSNKIHYGAEFVKNRDNARKWDIRIGNQYKAERVDKKIDGYFWIKADGSIIDREPGEFISEKGWLQYNLPVNLSRIYHVAYLKKKSEEHKWSRSSARGDENEKLKQDATYAEAYKKLHSALYRDGTKNENINEVCNKALRNALEKACRDPDQLVPVYYFKVSRIIQEEGKEKKEELVYMSGSAAGRIAQRRKWKDIMDVYTPCVNRLCPACLLFGTIADGGMKGHVRFTDAFMSDKKNTVCSRHTLQILSSPRTTAFEFYLKKPDSAATYWNYDFYGVTETDDSGKDESSHTNYYHLEKAVPRGRKMYWHHSPAADDSQKRNQNNTLQSLDKGEFCFKVYFDQITKEQLTDLIWVITLGDNTKNSKMQHKLGHAKPLGYGSIKLTVDGGKIRIFNKCSTDGNGNFTFQLCTLENQGIDAGSIEPTFNVNTDAVKSLLRMCNVDAVGKNNVDYPRTKENTPIFKWFSANRTNCRSLAVLPEPTRKDFSLSGGEKGRQSDQGYRENRITVILTGTSPDRNNLDMKVGYFDGGMVFDIPADIKSTEICVKVTNEKNGKKFCRYVDLA